VTPEGQTNLPPAVTARQAADDHRVGKRFEHVAGCAGSAALSRYSSLSYTERISMRTAGLAFMISAVACRPVLRGIHDVENREIDVFGERKSDGLAAVACLRHDLEVELAFEQFPEAPRTIGWSSAINTLIVTTGRIPEGHEIDPRALSESLRALVMLGVEVANTVGVLCLRGIGCASAPPPIFNLPQPNLDTSLVTPKSTDRPCRRGCR